MAIKILNIQQIREADASTILNEPVSSHALMERASIACFEWILQRIGREHPFMTFIGPGNNGGDGLVISRLLAAAGYKVKACLVNFSGTNTPDYLLNLDILREQSLVEILEIGNKDQLPSLAGDEIVIDALLGSGLARPVAGLAGDVIHHINKSGTTVIAIDMPSGLYCDQYSDPKAGEIIRADYTLSFQVPRLAFFLPENGMFVGDWTILDIGLSKGFIESVSSKSHLLEENDITELIKVRSQFDHKGTYGHGLLISGSFGKMGAAILASRAALRAGAGLITTQVPGRGYDILQTSVPEAMVSIDKSETCFSSLPDLAPFNAIAVGPGLGQDKVTATALKLLIQESKVPLILDADALNILGENKTWLSFLPKSSILTPHFKEFERLTRRADNGFERIELQRKLSIRFGIYIILKGAFSCISFPDGQCYFNPTGNPGMATGGSGDVLTGILLGLMTRGYSPAAACILGTYLHGRAGDIAAGWYGQEALIAGDITEAIPDAWQSLEQD